MQEKQFSGCKLQVTSCELRNKIQGKVRDEKTVFQSASRENAKNKLIIN